MARAQSTTSHDKIRSWVEARGGHPVAVKATRRAKSPGGLLRIDFDPKEESLQEISWDEFFKTFDGNDLASGASEDEDAGEEEDEDADWDDEEDDDDEDATDAEEEDEQPTRGKKKR